MSMTVLTALQLAGTAGAYFISTTLMPFLLLRKRLKTLPASARLAAYFTAGNFYVIALVLFLQLIRLSCRASLIIGALAPFPIVFLCKSKAARAEFMISAANVLRRITERDLTVKIKLVRLVKKLREGRYPRRFFKEILSAAAVLALMFFICGLNLFESFGYGHPDLIEYNARINELSRGGIPSDGVMSLGFNCMLYFLHTVYGIKTMTLLRLFGVVQTAALCLMLAAFMKTICKSVFVPYLTAAGFLAFGLFVPTVGEQLTFALPQIYGTAFLPPAMLFAVSFFKERHIERENSENKNCARLCLIFFGISVLTAFSALFGGNPSGVCLACAVCAAGGFCLDGVLRLLLKKEKRLNIASFCVFAAGTAAAFVCGVTRPLPRPGEEYVQSAAVTCAENILRDNKGKDNTWTIVSTYEIGIMTEEYGSHYEAAAFLRDLSEAAEVKIKTPAVYVCIEKNPVREESRAVMSELCRWVQGIRKFYPNEVKVYLETDSFVCYRIKQNEGFYNLAIDYGYNGEEMS